MPKNGTHGLDSQGCDRNQLHDSEAVRTGTSMSKFRDPFSEDNTAKLLQNDAFLEIGLTLIEHLTGEPADGRVFGLCQVGQ